MRTRRFDGGACGAARECECACRGPVAAFRESMPARQPGVEVAVAGAEGLPFADATVDAALSQLVVNFMRNPEAGSVRWRA
jgi:hypothetical protein